MSFKRYARLLALVAMLVLAVLVAACGSNDGGSGSSDQKGEVVDRAAQTTEAGGRPVRMAVIISDRVSDSPWNYAAYIAGNALQREGVVDFHMQENVPPADAPTAAGGFAEKGYQLVIGHTFESGAFFKEAGEHPDVNFAVANAEGKTTDNTADYDQPFYQGAYLEGMLAAGLTRSSTLGAVSAFNTPVCNAMHNAFIAGARRINPDLKLKEVFVGSFTDVQAAKEASLALHQQGPDTIISCGGATTVGVLEAAKEDHFYGFGYVGDLAREYPDIVAASVVWDVTPVYRTMVNDVKAGSFQPAKYYQLGIASGALSVKLNEEITRQIDAEVIDAEQAAEQQIADGELTVPYKPN